MKVQKGHPNWIDGNSRENIRALAPCPKCGVPPGEPCKWPAGANFNKRRSIGQSHHERQIIAHQIAKVRNGGKPLKRRWPRRRQRDDDFPVIE